MGTLRKLWRKMCQWFDKKGRTLVDEAKELIKDVFADMDIPFADLFDETKLREIETDIRARLRELRDDFTDWVVDLAIESLLDELKKRFTGGRAQ